MRALYFIGNLGLLGCGIVIAVTWLNSSWFRVCQRDWDGRNFCPSVYWEYHELDSQKKWNMWSYILILTMQWGERLFWGQFVVSFGHSKGWFICWWWTSIFWLYWQKIVFHNSDTCKAYSHRVKFMLVLLMKETTKRCTDPLLITPLKQTPFNRQAGYNPWKCRAPGGCKIVPDWQVNSCCKKWKINWDFQSLSCYILSTIFLCQ